MPNVHLFAKQENKWILIFVIDEDLAVTHLKNVRNEVAKYHPSVDPKKIQLHGAGSGPLIWVLKLVVKHKDRVHVKIGDRLLPKGIAIHQAVQALGVEPLQPQVEGHIIGHIAHNKISPEEITAVHTAYGDVGAGSRCWGALVNQLGWLLTKDKYTSAEARAVIKQLEKYPELYDAVMNKQEALARRDEEFKQGSLEKQSDNTSSKAFTEYQGHKKKNPRGGYYGKSCTFQDSSSTGGFTDDALTTIQSGMDSRATGFDSFSDQHRSGFNTAQQKVIDDIDQRQLAAEHQPPAGSDSNQSGIRELELTVRTLKGDVLLSRASKTVRPTIGVEKIQVNVVVDDWKMEPDELEGQIGRWSEEIAAIFERRG